MFAKLKSFVLHKGKLIPIDIEVNIYNKGFPKFDIVGLPGNQIKESKLRIKTAIQNSGYNFPAKKITVSLTPSNIEKNGLFYDLPIALGILFAANNISFNSIDTVFYGTLSLDGGLLSVNESNFLLCAFLYEQNIQSCIVPIASGGLISLNSTTKFYGYNSLKSVYQNLVNNCLYSNNLCFKQLPIVIRDKTFLSDSFIIGQKAAKHACLIAASGGHSLFLKGFPGLGKTLLSKYFYNLLPVLSLEHLIDLAKTCNHYNFQPPLINFSSKDSLGAIKKGLVKTAFGLGFFDEIYDYKQEVLEHLKMVLDSNISDKNSSFLFCGNFCKCGYFGHLYNKCTCTFSQIKYFKQKLPKVLLDRIDLYCELDNSIENINTNQPEDWLTLYNTVLKCRQLQLKRQNKLNASLTFEDFKKYKLYEDIVLDKAKVYVEKLNLGYRDLLKLLKVARTCADLHGALLINEDHLYQALNFKMESSLSDLNI